MFNNFRFLPAFYSIQTLNWLTKAYLHYGEQSAICFTPNSNLNVNLIQKHTSSWYIKLAVTLGNVNYSQLCVNFEAFSGCSFPVVLSLPLGSFQIHRLLCTQQNIQRTLWTLATLASLISQIHSQLRGIPRTHFVSPIYAVAWKLSLGGKLGNHRVTLFVYSLTDITVISCLLSNIWKLLFHMVFFQFYSCLRQEVKSIPYYIIWPKVEIPLYKIFFVKKIMLLQIVFKSWPLDEFWRYLKVIMGYSLNLVTTSQIFLGQRTVVLASVNSSMLLISETVNNLSHLSLNFSIYRMVI